MTSFSPPFDDDDPSQYEEGDQSDDLEYYNFLNVPRAASETEINAAYKRLSRLYHPDKHVDQEKKKKAEALFAKLKVAHEGKQVIMSIAKVSLI